VRHSQGIGEQRRRRREHHVGRHRGADEEVDVLRRHACIDECRTGGGQSDVGERFLFRCDSSLADPSALPDPLVGSVHDLRELGVRHDLLGHVHAEARDADADALSSSEHG
jgi:hypothetical protein